MSLAETLKKAREGKNLTLKDISKRTRISEKFLEMIEDGTYDFAPKPYVRAFIRSYAKVVGLNPDEVIKQYESEMESLEPKEEIAREKQIPAKFDIVSFVLENILWIVGGFIVIFVAIFLFINVEGEKSPQKQTPRKSFETAIEEISKGGPIRGVEPENKIDSLELKIMAIDTVWFSVLIDTSQVKEFLMPPNTTLLLKAKDSFNFIIGNAGGVKFILNGYELGAIGERGKVVRNYVINRETLKSLSIR